MAVPDIIDHVTSLLVAAGFRKSSYRFRFDREPEGGRDGMFRVEVPSVDPVRADWATGQRVWNLGTLSVQLAYFRGGGDAGGGDRKSVGKRALDDIDIVISTLQDPDGYVAATTKIRAVRFNSFAKASDLPRSEIWEVKFDVEFESEAALS